MPRRSIDYSTPGYVNVIDIKTGKFVEAPVLPVVCASIRHHRIQLGIEQKELAARIGVHKNAISSWETGRTRPDLNLIPAICRELRISPYELFGMKEPEVLYTPREERLVSNYRKLEEKFRSHVDTVMQSLVQAQDAENAPELFEIVFQPVRLAAGPDAAIRDITETEIMYLHDTPLLHRADSIYKVNGDSMEPTFHDGDMVFIEHIPGGNPLQFGEIGAFTIGNECYIKEYQPDGLHSHNGHYPVMRFDGDAASVFLIGRVLGIVDPDLFASSQEIQRYLDSQKEE